MPWVAVAMQLEAFHLQSQERLRLLGIKHFALTSVGCVICDGSLRLSIIGGKGCCGES